MKFPFHIIFFLFFVSCDKEEGFPKDFAGNWEFDLDSVYTEIENMELPEDDPTNRNPDITLANRELKWVPLIDVDQGLLKTIEYI